jgi:hypothetical protein
LGDGLSEMGGETRISVTDDFAGESEPSEYIFQVDFRYASSGDCGGAGKKYRASRTAVIYYRQDCVESVAFG